MKLLNENDEEVEAMSRLEDKEMIVLVFISREYQKYQNKWIKNEQDTRYLSRFYNALKSKVELLGIFFSNEFVGIFH